MPRMEDAPFEDFKVVRLYIPTDVAGLDIFGVVKQVLEREFSKLEISRFPDIMQESGFDDWYLAPKGLEPDA